MSQSNLITRDSDNHTTERGVPVSRIRIDDLPIAEELTPEQEALILGAGLKSFRPSLEVLEERAVPALISPSAPNIDFDRGTVKIDANIGVSAQRNVATVRYVENSNATRVQVNYNFQSVEIDADLVQRIVYEGNNTLKDQFTNNTIKPSQFNDLETRDTYNTPFETFKMTGPATLDNDSASGRRMVNGERVGNNTPPPLSWNAPPPETVRLGLDMTDIDGTRGPFTHMRLNINSALPRNLEEAMRPGIGTLEANGEDQNEYLGPNPPGREKHRYVFTLTAYDARGNVIAQTQFQSTFQYGPGLQAQSNWTPPASNP